MGKLTLKQQAGIKRLLKIGIQYHTSFFQRQYACLYADNYTYISTAPCIVRLDDYNADIPNIQPANGDKGIVNMSSNFLVDKMKRIIKEAIENTITTNLVKYMPDKEGIVKELVCITAGNFKPQYYDKKLVDTALDILKKGQLHVSCAHSHNLIIQSDIGLAVLAGTNRD